MNFITLLPKDLEFRSLFQYWCQCPYCHQLKPDARFFFHHFKLLNRSFLAELTLLRMDVHHFPSVSFRWDETYTKHVNWAKSGRNLRGNFACFDPYSNNDKRTVTACAYNSLYFLRYRKGRSCLHISENRLLHNLCRFAQRYFTSTKILLLISTASWQLKKVVI